MITVFQLPVSHFGSRVSKLVNW